MVHNGFVHLTFASITRGVENPRSIRRLLINTPALFEDMVEEILDSGKTRNVDDIEWTFVIDASSLLEGGGNPKVPEWVGARDAMPTWKHYTLNGEPINCAAFSLCYAMATHKYRIDAIKEAALAMTLRYGWSLTATAQTILNFFPRDYPQYRITILTAGHDKFDEFTEQGAEFEYIESDFKPTVACKKKIIYLYHQYGVQSYSSHFALAVTPLKALCMDQHNFRWCHKCCRASKYGLATITACVYCTDEVRKKKKARLCNDPVLCLLCNETPCNKEKCPRKCGNCKVNLKQGYDLEKSTLHRPLNSYGSLETGAILPLKQKPKYGSTILNLQSNARLALSIKCLSRITMGLLPMTENSLPPKWSARFMKSTWRSASTCSSNLKYTFLKRTIQAFLH